MNNSVSSTLFKPNSSAARRLGRSMRTAGAFLIASAMLFQQFIFALPAANAASQPVSALVSPNIVISQVYGGGGNSGAPFTHDFVELFNRGSEPVSIGGWSIQYASATGTGLFGSGPATITELPAVTIQPGQYYLVQQAAGAGNGVPLPSPDHIDATPIAMAAGAGKVALASISVGLGCNGSAGQPCSPEQLANIVDLVGYGNANFFEGAGPAPTLTNASSAIRAGGGCADSDNNNLDFSVSNPPTPRNTTSPTNSCAATPTNPSGIGNADPSTVFPGDTTLLTVAVTPGTNPTNTDLGVTANLSDIGGSAAQQFFDDGTNGDVIAGDNVFSYSATVALGTMGGAKVLPATIFDGQGRSGMTNIALTVQVVVIGESLPFLQNWSNIDLITIDHDWSGVPGIVGYRGDGMAGGTGIDPQTVLQDGSHTPVNVTANHPDPNTFTSGGVAEFHLADPVVAFQGSGTARAPHIVISVDTTGHSNIAVFYNLRDVDGSGDNSMQPVALQYRIGNTGSYTNIPAAFVPDASSGPNDATLVTPVAVLLPAEVNDHPLVQLRIITADAVGSDEWIGIDDIQVVPNGTLPLSGSGSASPNVVDAGTNSLLTVTVNPATNPTSTGIGVTGDLTAIGGAASQQFFDDGTNGDATAGDNIFSYLATIDGNTFSGNKSLPVAITDAQSRTAQTTISLSVRAPRDPNLHLTMGNPSNATTDIDNPFNYLLPKNEYVMSYHRDRGIPNWVAWHLDTSWIGSAPRQDDFRPDESLPAGWYQVTQFDYSGSGFDRGHHTPSGDRTATIPENSATFFMTNMMPQAPDNNQGPWEQMESYSRSLANQGNELYIFMGGHGSGGTGSNGGVTHTITDGRVTVPAYTWKVVMVLPNGPNDVDRVDENTRAFAVIMPNTQGIRTTAWQNYSATVDQVEALTGYDFFSNVPVHIQDVIEARVDAETNTPPTAHSQTVNTDEDTPVGITLTATDPNVNNVLTFTVTSGPAHGTLSGEGADLTYTSDPGYNGPDSFVFEVFDGGAVSGATVTIEVAAINDPPSLDPIADQTVYLGDTLNFTATATDPDLPNDTLTFSLTGIVPAGASIDPGTGVFEWTPRVDQAGAIYSIGVRVTDSGGLFDDQTVNIGVAYPWSGVLGPLAGGNAVVNGGSTVPVKFRLTGLASEVTDATAYLFYAPMINGEPGPESPAMSQGAPKNSNLFQFDAQSGEYVFTWNTRNIAPGVYRLRIDLGDGVLRTVFVTLR